MESPGLQWSKSVRSIEKLDDHSQKTGRNHPVALLLINHDSERSGIHPFIEDYLRI